MHLAPFAGAIALSVGASAVAIVIAFLLLLGTGVVLVGDAVSSLR